MYIIHHRNYIRTYHRSYIHIYDFHIFTISLSSFHWFITNQFNDLLP